MSRHAFAPRRRTAIRWDRVGRIALVGTLFVIMLLYLSPAKRWFEQSATADRQHQELRDLQAEHRELEQRVRELDSPNSLEREARQLGMIKQGERAYVIENLPGD